MPNWAAIRLALHERSRGRCEGCGQERGNTGEVHHRKLRSRGGGHELANLLLLHPGCHRHAHAEPAWATRHGWMIHGWQEPSEVPIVRCGPWLAACDHPG